jgi:group II intron reverse transcriptase/maturase
MFEKHYVVNHCTYLIGIKTDLGNTACTERLTERMFAEIKFTMVRITNPYNSMPGSEVPNMRCVFNYVVLESLKRQKQAVTRCKLMEGRPKVNIRRGLMEFGILQHLEKCGERRNRSTGLITRKGSSLIQFTESELSGSYRGKQLLKLKSDLTKGSKANNLSKILSDPKFLVSCWVRIRSNKGSLTPAFDGSMDGIKSSWFTETATQIRNGKYQFKVARRKYIPKPNSDKLRTLTMPSSKDKIIQEGIRFLLEIIFEPTFKDNSYGWRPNRGCLTAINDIKMKCKGVSWYIEGDIEQQFPSLNHKFLISILNSKINDQAFIDMVYKYIKVGYGESIKQATPMKVGVIQGGILSPILANIYMQPFDEWVTENLKPNFDKGTKRARNPEYFKKYRKDGQKVKDKTMRSILTKDPDFKRLYYFRYADDFIIGVDGTKEDCKYLRNQIKEFLSNKINLTLNVEKTKITNAQCESAKFLGYIIHKTPMNKMPIRRDKKGRLSRVVPRPIIDAPIREIVKKLIERKYVKRNGNPTRNARFINHTLPDIINHYRAVERGILNYYSLANNYSRLAGRVHYLLKYSCVLTIGSKMKLNTKKKVFKKYGKDLNILNEKGKIIACYPTIEYKKPKKVYTKSVKVYNTNLVEILDSRLSRGRKDLKGPCIVCGSNTKIEVHHVRSLRKRPKKGDFLQDMMSKMNRKQVPLCQKCHADVHAGRYDGRSFKT